MKMTKNKLLQAVKGLTLAAGMAVGSSCGLPPRGVDLHSHPSMSY